MVARISWELSGLAPEQKALVKGEGCMQLWSLPESQKPEPNRGQGGSQGWREGFRANEPHKLTESFASPQLSHYSDVRRDRKSVV